LRIVDEMEIINIKAGNEEISMKTNRSDLAAALVRGLIGAAPLVGPLIAEILTATIPRQKMDRVVTFVKILDDKLSYLEEDVVKVRIKSEEFADLLEDGITQASRSLSDERKSHIASLLKNSLTRDDLKHLEHKKILALLNELNDIEILFLKFYWLHAEDQREFWGKHKDALFRPPLYFGVGQVEIDQDALKESYTTNLRRLGLVNARFPRVEKGKLPDFDEKTGTLKASAVQTSSLGKLLLRYIDLEQE
jgi:hypothetical protein